MMKQLNVIFRVLVLTAFVAAGMPLQMPEDAHYDGRLDLRDVISAVRQFEGSAFDPQRFAHTVRGAVSTLEVAADLKTVIHTDCPKTTIGAFSSIMTAVSAVSVETADLSSLTLKRRDTTERFSSADQTPPTPPPKLV